MSDDAVLETEFIKKRKEGKSHRSKPKRSHSEERLYHGFVSDLFLGDEIPVANAPVPSARTAGPLAGMRGSGAWGTVKRPLRTLTPGAPASVVGVGVRAADGRKREARGGESEDGFSALCDITHYHDETTGPECTSEKGGPAEEAPLRSTRVVEVGARVFHLLGIFDGHRSNHAARYCAEQLGDEVARRLAVAGVLKPMGASEAPGEAQEEEAAVREALSAAVVSVDAAFCRKRWASFVRDNGKKFYITCSEEVNNDLELEGYDSGPLETAWRTGLARVSEGLARRMGLDDFEVEAFVRRQQERWYCYKKPLFPGCALCAVLVDVHRGKLFCANVGDCGALLFLPGKPDGQTSFPVGCFTTSFPKDGTTGGSPAGARLDRNNQSFLLLSRPHKPADRGELARVCGTPEGFVEVHGERVTLDNAHEMAQRVAAAQAMGRKALYRINRDVSLSRAIGDFDLREFGVVATPDVTVYSFAQPGQDGGDSVAPVPVDPTVVLLVLATDGVWDVMDAGDVAALLEHSPEAAAAARNAKAAACVPWEPGAHAPESFLPSLSRDDGNSADSVRAIGAANDAADHVAHMLVKSAKAVTKNNDDVTVVVAALVVAPPLPGAVMSSVPAAAAPQAAAQVRAPEALELLPALMPGALGVDEAAPSAETMQAPGSY